MNSPTLPIILLLLAMTSIQFGSSLAKGLFPLLGPLGATSVRLGLAAVLMLAFWRPWRERVGRGGLTWALLYGASLGGMNLFFFLSLERIPLGIAVALEFMGPLAVAVFSSKQRLDYLWAILAFAGTLLLLPSIGDGGPLDQVGIIFALISGVFWALYIIFGQKAGQRMSGGTAAAWGMSAAAICAAPAGLLFSEGDFLSWYVLGQGSLVAILSSALPYSLEMFALRRLPRKTFGILMSLEPALGALMGLAYLGEALSALQWLAIFLVILSSAGSSLTARNQALG